RHVSLREARDRLLSTALTLPVGTAPGRYTVEHRRDRERSGQRPLAVLGSLALNLGVTTLPLPPLVGEYWGAGPLLL
ncbi:MAG: hypothetical protein M3495_20930, partial [Pseudomonadota bacterium]|nr:hypothetical protein [Pseudomonadota bacterium]